MDRGRVIEGMEALQRSMSIHQCYTCSYEFIDTANEFGTNIVSEAIELLKEQEKEIEQQPEIVRCKDCRQNNQCSIQFKFACADNPGEWFCAYGKRRET